MVDASFCSSYRCCIIIDVLATSSVDSSSRCSCRCCLFCTRHLVCIHGSIFCIHWVAILCSPFHRHVPSCQQNFNGYGVQFRREWDAQRLLKLHSKRLGHWNIVNAKASNGLMAVSRTKQQLAVLYCTFDDEGCWLHLDVFSEQIFDLDGFLIEDA